MVVTKEAQALMAEVKKDEVAYQQLRDKAVWEHMTLFAVLREWGDPREWKEVK